MSDYEEDFENEIIGADAEEEDHYDDDVEDEGEEVYSQHSDNETVTMDDHKKSRSAGAAVVHDSYNGPTVDDSNLQEIAEMKKMNKKLHKQLNNMDERLDHINDGYDESDNSSHTDYNENLTSNSPANKSIKTNNNNNSISKNNSFSEEPKSGRMSSRSNRSSVPNGGKKKKRLTTAQIQNRELNNLLKQLEIYKKENEELRRTLSKSSNSQRVIELENLLAAKEIELERLKEDNKGLINVQRLQSKALTENVDEQNQAKLKVYEEDTRVLKAQIRKYKAQLEEAHKQIGQQHNKILKLETKCDKMSLALSDKNLTFDDVDSVQKMKADLEEKAKIIADLEHKVAVLTKVNETNMKKARITAATSQQEVADLKRQIEALRNELQEKDKELRLSALAISKRAGAGGAKPRVHRVQPLAEGSKSTPPTAGAKHNANNEHPRPSTFGTEPKPPSPTRVPRFGSMLPEEKRKAAPQSRLPIPGQRSQPKVQQQQPSVRKQAPLQPAPGPQQATDAEDHQQQQQQPEQGEQHEGHVDNHNDTTYDEDFEDDDHNQQQQPQQQQQQQQNQQSPTTNRSAADNSSVVSSSTTTAAGSTVVAASDKPQQQPTFVTEAASGAAEEATPAAAPAAPTGSVFKPAFRRNRG